MLSQSSQEFLFPLPNNGVLVGMAYEETTPMHSRSPHLDQ